MQSNFNVQRSTKLIGYFCSLRVSDYFCDKETYIDRFITNGTRMGATTAAVQIRIEKATENRQTKFRSYLNDLRNVCLTFLYTRWF